MITKTHINYDLFFYIFVFCCRVYPPLAKNEENNDSMTSEGGIRNNYVNKNRDIIQKIL